MRTRLFILSALLLAFAAACTLEPAATPSDKVNATIETLTRTQLTPDGNIYKVLWNKGDRIAVNSASATAYYTADNG